MAKVGAIISRALRIIRAIDPDENPEPRQYETAIEALNAMMARWEADGLSLGWIAVSNPDETFPLAVETERAIAYNLAVELRPEYGANIDPDVMTAANSGWSALVRDNTNRTHVRLALDLPSADPYRASTAAEFYNGV